MARMVAKAVGLLWLAFLLAASMLLTTQQTGASASASSGNVIENSWVSKTPMHGARAHLGVAVVNGKIYAIGGDSLTFFGYTADIINSGAVQTGTGWVVGTNE